MTVSNTGQQFSTLDGTLESLENFKSAHVQVPLRPSTPHSQRNSLKSTLESLRQPGPGGDAGGKGTSQSHVEIRVQSLPPSAQSWDKNIASALPFHRWHWSYRWAFSGWATKIHSSLAVSFCPFT